MAAKKPGIPTPTTTNGFNGRNGHVSLAREEYEALAAREEMISVMTVENAKLQTCNLDITQTLEVQVKHLSNFELKVRHLERITALQEALINSFKDKEKLAGLAELSEFWRQWTITTSNTIDSRKVDRAEVVKFEPDLFKMWRNWVNDSGKADRSLNSAGTRTEAQPQMQSMMQTHMLARKHEENAKLATRVQQLEAELEALKKETKQP
jgi:polyhydroxyalkanoate synthesis regulator phasin